MTFIWSNSVYLKMEMRNFIIICKTFLLICFSFITITTNATNYYVSSASGNNGFSGLSLSSPKQTIQAAADLTVPGDTVFIMNGTYNSTSGPVLTLLPANSGAQTQYITYKAYPGHKPKITASGDVWNAILINGSYIIIDSLELQGNNANLTLTGAMAAYDDRLAGGTDWTRYAAYNTNGITIGGSNESQFPHHVIIRHCRVHDFPGGGIETAKTDYITIENNVVYNNAWYMMYAGSGISLFHSWNSDSEIKTKNFIRNNICYNNKTQVPWISTNKMSDGNGIIIDDNKNTQDPTAGPAYIGRTRVENNISYNNGGSGIHAYSCKSVDLVNNTAYNNGLVVDYAEIFANACNDVNILNNIMFAKNSGSCNSNYSNINVIYDYNICYNGAVAVQGAHDKFADPLFQFISTDPALSIFYLKSTSPAIDAGTSAIYSRLDIIGTSRPKGAGVDCGAYEWDASVVIGIKDINSSSLFFKVYPNPAKNLIRIASNSNNEINSIDLFSVIGEKLESLKNRHEKEVELSLGSLNAGIYVLRINNKENIKIIKQ